MGAPFSVTEVSSYNANPPPDDGSESTQNRIDWSTIKTKLADTLKTAHDTSEAAILAAFGRIIGGGAIASTAVDYTAGASDQGKQIVVTVAAKTVTTPDATVVLAPFLFGVFNASSGAITLDGSGAQTVNGVASLTIAPGQGMLVFTDGTNWRAYGEVGTFVGKQMGYGQIVNATIAESNAANAATFSLKTLAGADPSAADPVLLCFRNATSGTGNYVYRTVTAALSLAISAGSTLGIPSATACKVWAVLFDDGGTIRLGVMNTLNGTSIYPLGRVPLASSTAEGGAGAADSAHVFYTGAAVTSKPYLILGYAEYASGLSTAGNWNVSPQPFQLFGPGVPLPGEVIQIARTDTGAVATGTTALPFDDTIPQSGEGDQYMSQAITPVSAANLLEIDASGIFFNGGAGNVAAALFQDSTANALKTNWSRVDGISSNVFAIPLNHSMKAGTTSATTFKVRAGSSSVGTTTFNGESGARLFGGVANSFIEVRERMT